MPRRSGKTTATAQIALAFLLNIEHVSIAVFAPSEHQSSLFVGQVKE